jgi:hypothetical protein
MPKSEVFFVTPELQQVLDNLPAKRPRSILDPFRPFILRWRREGRTYREIQQILAVECRVQVTYQMLFKFVKQRSRPRKPQPDLEIEPATTQPGNSSSAAVLPEARKPRMTAEERAALRASFDQPLFPTEEQKPLFVRRPGPTRNLNFEQLGDKTNGSSSDTNSSDREEAGTNK